MQIYSRMLVLFGLLLASVAAGASPLVDGDAKAGKTKAAPCAACHGAQGNSSNPQWPKLAGQHGPYILRQLMHYKSGKRQNAVMAGQAANLSEQDMKDLSAFFAQQNMQPAAASEKLVKRGSQLYRSGDAEKDIPACAGCHGPAGLGNAAAAYPRIGGQHAQYLATQLKAYRDGKRSDYPKGKIMAGVAENMSDADIKAVASYIQGLQPRTQAKASER